MSDELALCPFCGSANVQVVGMADKPQDCYCWHVECQECHCSGRRVYRDEGAHRETAIAAWNRRVPAPAAGVPVEVADYIQYALNRAWHNVEQDWLTDEEKAKRRAPIDAALRWLASVTQQPQPGQEGE